jgi:ABC-type sugar transport system permease subunit
MVGYRLRKRATPYLFISPFFVGYAVFGAFPLGWALVLSLHAQTGLLEPPVFVGLRNYLLLFGDSRFLHAITNTFGLALGAVLLVLPLALALAVLVDSPRCRFKQTFRLGYYFPAITSSVVVAIMFLVVFDPDSGLLNTALRALHLPAVGWLIDPAWVIPSVILVTIWGGLGINALYFSAGLQNIPGELREAAHMDGASGWQTIRYITLPLLRPVLLFTSVLAVIGAFNQFGLPYLLLNQTPGPGDAGLFVTTYLYFTSFQDAQFGYAAAIGFAVAVIIAVLTLLQLRFFGVFEEG